MNKVRTRENQNRKIDIEIRRGLFEFLQLHKDRIAAKTVKRRNPIINGYPSGANLNPVMSLSRPKGRCAEKCLPVLLGEWPRVRAAITTL
jgi:hypothetical protein